MKKKFLLLICMLPALLLAQQGKNKPCNDKKRRIDVLPCTIIERVWNRCNTWWRDTNKIYWYIKRYSVDAEELKPYQISLIANEKVWKTIIKLNCRFCKLYININKNTGEVLNFYKSED